MAATPVKVCSTFRGDGDHLLDALIAASAARAPENCGYTGFGRELQPFSDFLGENPVGCAKNNGSRRPPSSAGGSPQRNTRAAKHQRRGSPTTSVHIPIEAALSMAAAARAEALYSSQLGGSRADAAICSNRKVPAGPSLSSSPPATSQFACPGMFSSPKPETVPLPKGLLMRAAAPVPPMAA